MFWLFQSGLFREFTSNLAKVLDEFQFQDLGLGQKYLLISTTFEVQKLVKNSS